jgi:hypothetical protein
MAVSYPFVGRENVLGELRAALERAEAGRGGLVTLTGAAGAGKTRTAEEAGAHAGGFRALWTWCPPETAGRAFRPWSRLLRELVADDAGCVRLVAGSPPLRALVSGAAPGALRGAVPEAARLRLAGDVAELLATAARHRPLLLILDDVHAADASSLRLLLETADAARTAPVLLLATARDDDTAWHDRAWARAQLLRRGRALPLGPLSEREVATLVTEATGEAPGEGAVRALVRHTGGDAFFVTEFLRGGGWGVGDGTEDGAGAVRGGEGLGAGDGGWPSSYGSGGPSVGAGAEGGRGSRRVAGAGGRRAGERFDQLGGPPVYGTGGASAAIRVAVGARLGELSPRGARVLDVASVLGTRFRLDVLAEAAEVPLGEMRALLGEAAGAGMLAEAGADRGAFRHDLLREAVYGALAPGERAALHHAAAEVLAGYARRGRDTGPAEVAHHLLLAGPGHARLAADYARQAAVRAQELFAYEDAARWYERAVEKLAETGVDPGSEGTESTEKSAESTDPADLVDVLLGLGSARLGAGEWDAARAAHLRAAGLAREVRRPDLLARAALGLGTGPVGFEVDLADREQVDLLGEARAALAGEPAHAALRAAVTARLSLAAGLVEPEKHRVALAEEAVRTAREVGDPATLGVALAALCDARPGPDQCRERLDWSAGIVATARELRDPVLELLGRRMRLVALMETGAFAAADAEALAYETAVRPLRRPLYAWYPPLWRGTRALMEGRYDDCAAALDEVEELGRRAGSGNAGLLATTQRWCLYAETGDVAGLERVREAARTLEAYSGLWPRVTLALLAAQFGRLDEAAQRLAAVTPRLPGAVRDSEWLPMLAQAAETVGALGTHPAAPLLYDLLVPYAGLFAVEGIGAAVRGPVDRHLALLATAVGDGERARKHRERALEAARDAGAVGLVERIAGETGAGRGTAVPDFGRTASARPPSASDRGPSASDRPPHPHLPEDLGPLFRHEGPLWHLRYAGQDIRLPDSKGLHDIAVLLARPGTPVPAVELAAPPVTGAAPADGLHAQGDTGEVIDATARAAYRRRLHELAEEATDADVTGDAVRSERIAVERDALVRQLSAAYGIGGRVRRTGSPAERARTTVTARIHAAVRRVTAAHPELGRHLHTALRTGTLCVYDPETPPDWCL